MKTTLIIPDCHHPSVDTKAWDLVLKVGLNERIDTLVIIGDFGDFAAVTSHAKNHRQRATMLCEELFACNAALAQLDEIKATTRIFVMGNHEDRLSRYINERCPELHGMHGTNIETALQLKDRGYKVVPYRSHMFHEGVYYTHDTGTAGLNAHRTSLQRYQRDVVIGHTHRIGFETKRTITGLPITGYMCGWLGDADKCAGYMHAASSATDWCHGFGMVYTHDNRSHIQPVVIQEDYSCVVQGRFYK